MEDLERLDNGLCGDLADCRLEQGPDLVFGHVLDVGGKRVLRQRNQRRCSRHGVVVDENGRVQPWLGCACGSVVGAENVEAVGVFGPEALVKLKHHLAQGGELAGGPQVGELAGQRRGPRDVALVDRIRKTQERQRHRHHHVIGRKFFAGAGGDSHTARVGVVDGRHLGPEADVLLLVPARQLVQLVLVDRVEAVLDKRIAAQVAVHYAGELRRQVCPQQAVPQLRPHAESLAGVLDLVGRAVQAVSGHILFKQVGDAHVALAGVALVHEAAVGGELGQNLVEHGRVHQAAVLAHVERLAVVPKVVDVAQLLGLFQERVVQRVVEPGRAKVVADVWVERGLAQKKPPAQPVSCLEDNRVEFAGVVKVGGRFDSGHSGADNDHRVRHDKKGMGMNGNERK